MLPGKIRGIHHIELIRWDDPQLLDVVGAVVLNSIHLTGVLVVHEGVRAVEDDKMSSLVQMSDRLQWGRDVGHL